MADLPVDKNAAIKFGATLIAWIFAVAGAAAPGGLYTCDGACTGGSTTTGTGNNAGDMQDLVDAFSSPSFKDIGVVETDAPTTSSPTTSCTGGGCNTACKNTLAFFDPDSECGSYQTDPSNPLDFGTKANETQCGAKFQVGAGTPAERQVDNTHCNWCTLTSTCMPKCADNCEDNGGVCYHLGCAAAGRRAATLGAAPPPGRRARPLGASIGIFRTCAETVLGDICSDTDSDNNCSAIGATKAFSVFALLTLSFLWIYHALEAFGKHTVLPPVVPKFIRFGHLLAALWCFFTWTIACGDACVDGGFSEIGAPGHAIFLYLIVMLSEIGVFLFITKVGDGEAASPSNALRKQVDQGGDDVLVDGADSPGGQYGKMENAE